MKQRWLILFSVVCLYTECIAEITVTNYAEEQTKSDKKSTLHKQSITNACWEQAEKTYGVPAKLLVAIAKVETNFRPRTISKPNKNGSYDIGLMQINSYWLPTLSKYGISENDLLQPCTNVMVGAWILSSNINRLGYNWNAIGAYNAKTNWKRDKYAKKVHQAIIELGYNN